jgi:hypothetical protein
MFRNWAGTRETKFSSQYLKIRAVVWNEVLNWKAANCWKPLQELGLRKYRVSKRSQSGQTEERLSRYHVLYKPRLWTLFWLSFSSCPYFLSLEFLFTSANLFCSISSFLEPREYRKIQLFFDSGGGFLCQQKILCY